MSVNTSERICRELARRGSAKVAQYEVLGNGCKRRARPAGTIETLGPHSHMLPYESNVNRPVRDVSLIETTTQYFVLGYFRRVPPGLA
jgi:hypothetical protein